MEMEVIGRLFSHMPRLETEHLILRSMRESDSADMFEYACREDVTEYLLWLPHPDEGYTRDYLSYVVSKYKEREFFDWALTLKSSGKMIGTCGFNSFDAENNSTEIGYVLNPVYWGRGYACEAVEAVIRFGFIDIGLNRIEARHMAGNDRSAGVMKHCGMQYEGTLRDAMFVKNRYRTISVYSILKRDFISAEIEKNHTQEE